MYLRASECNPRGLGSCQRKITSSLLIAMSTSMALAPNFKADLVAAKVFSQCPRGSPPACPITKKSCFLLCWQNDPGKSQLFPFLRWYKKAILYRSDFCCIYLPSGGVIMTDLGVMNTMNTICQEDDYTGKVEQSSWEHIWSTMNEWQLTLGLSLPSCCFCSFSETSLQLMRCLLRRKTSSVS